MTVLVVDADRKPAAVSPVVESTTLGAALLAGSAVDVWADLTEAASAFTPTEAVESATQPDRAASHRAVERAAGWIPELSALDF